MIKLGITGGIGSGKTVVSEVFKILGVPVYNADLESKRIMDTSPVVREKLIAYFGDFLYIGEKLDRKLLAKSIFSNKEALLFVNGLVHPEVKKDLEVWFERNSHFTFAALESAILFESGFDAYLDKSILVFAPLDERIARTVKRDGCTREEVLKRIENQLSDDNKRQKCDYVIDNGGSCSVISQVSKFYASNM